MRKLSILILCFFASWLTASAQKQPSVADLKLADAYRLEIDQDIAFQLSWSIDKERYFKQLILNKYEQVFEGEQAVPHYYIRQIYMSLPQRAATQELMRIEQRIDSIFEVLSFDWSNAHIEKLIAQYSEEKQARWLNSFEETREFQRVLNRLEPGEVSKPFKTPKGVHILQLLERKEKQPLENPTWRIKNLDYALAQLNLSINRQGQGELLARGRTTLPLIQSSRMNYTQKEFDTFAQGNKQMGLDALWLKFQEFVVFQEMKASLFTNPKFEASLDSLWKNDLIEAAFQQRVLESNPITEQELDAFYKQHRSAYAWDKPRFEGVIVYCKNSKVRKALHQELSVAPLSEWGAIIDGFNTSEMQVHSLRGKFEKGENAAVDAYVFKKGKKKHFRPKGYTKTRVYGEVLLGPASFHEIKDQVEKDYLLFLEQNWINELKQDYKTGKLPVNF